MAAFKLKVSFKTYILVITDYQSDAIASAYTKASGFKREIDWSSYEQNINNKDLVAEFKVHKNNMYNCKVLSVCVCVKY